MRCFALEFDAFGSGNFVAKQIISLSHWCVCVCKALMRPKPIISNLIFVRNQLLHATKKMLRQCVDHTINREGKKKFNKNLHKIIKIPFKERRKKKKNKEFVLSYVFAFSNFKQNRTFSFLSCVCVLVVDQFFFFGRV